MKKRLVLVSALAFGVVSGCTSTTQKDLSPAQPTYAMGAPVNNQGIITQGQSGGSNTIINPFAPTQDGLYQGTTQVGELQGNVTIDEPHGIVVYQAVHYGAFPDPSQPLRFRGLFITCEGMQVREPNTFVGRIDREIAGGPPCKIVGHVAISQVR